MYLRELVTTRVPIHLPTEEVVHSYHPRTYNARCFTFSNGVFTRHWLSGDKYVVSDFELREIKPWYDTMILLEYRDMPCLFFLSKQTGKVFVFEASFLEPCFRRGLIIHKTIQAEWCIVKNRQQYFILPYSLYK